MTFLTSALSELVTLAAPPGLVDALADDARPDGSGVSFDDQAIALRAIDAGLDEARASGTRVAVCVADLAPGDSTFASADAIDAADAWLLPRLRDGDRLYRVGSTLVVVPRGSTTRVRASCSPRASACCRAMPARRLWGIAISPVHGDDAATLFERARASARRDRLQRERERTAPVS